MEKILVLDFGGQYNQLIARRVRDHHIYAEILPYTTPLETIRAGQYKGIIFTGGPNSVYDEKSPHYDPAILDIGVPILGICYGCQLIAWMKQGRVETAPVSEYGKIDLSICGDSPLFGEVPASSVVWMSHTDYIAEAPAGFEVVAKTDNCPCAAMQNPAQKLYAVQFHPEVTHSQYGDKMLENFLYTVCGCQGDWVMDSFIEDTVAALREQIGDKQVILGLSGGVDSSVAAGLLSRAIGKQLTCVFVDQGLMRKDEGDFVEQTFTKLFDMTFVRVNCGDVFMQKLQGVTDPEAKRHIIGDEFYKVFWEEIKRRAKGDAFFAQGTIYPDRIESGKGASGKGAGSAVIKTHHNQREIPKDIDFLGVIEPLRDLFKDEVRALGRELGLPEYLVMRQPFPGPGLAIRCLGAVSKDKLDILRDADFIFRDEIAKAHLEQTMNQYFAVLTNMRSVGVMGDGRTYDYTLALRSVTTTDFMTANWTRIPYDVLDRVSVRIVNEVKGINRIVYDITSKPPATIEWE